MVLDKFLICAFPDVVRAAAGAVECILKKLFFNWSKLFFQLLAVRAAAFRMVPG